MFKIFDDPFTQLHGAILNATRPVTVDVEDVTNLDGTELSPVFHARIQNELFTVTAVVVDGGGAGIDRWTMDHLGGAAASAHGVGEPVDVVITASGLTAGLADYYMANPMTTNGDLITRAAGVAARIAVGANGKVLTVVAGAPAWADPTGGMTNPMTTKGDIIIGDTAGAPIRLSGSGTDAWVLTYDTATAQPKWAASAGGGGGGVTSNLKGFLGVGFVTPVDGDFAWFNQNSATKAVSAITGAIEIGLVSAGGADAITGRVHTITASAAYTYTAFISGSRNADGISSYGMIISDGTKVITFERHEDGGTGWYVNQWTNSTTYSAHALTNTPATSDSPVWMRITDNLTNRKYQYSYDGENWITLLSEASATFLTETKIGFGGNSHGAAVDITLHSWTSSTTAIGMGGLSNPMTTTGDMIYSSDGSGTPARRAIGSAGQVMTVSGGLPTWAAAPAGTPSSWAALVKLSGPVGYWKMLEGSGTSFADSSGFTNAGTGHNTTASGSGGPWTGKVNFNGTTAYMDFAARPVGAGLQPFTLEWWIKPAAGTFVGLIDTAPSAGGTFRNYNTGFFEKQGASAIAIASMSNAWHHLAVIVHPYNSGIIHAYVMIDGAVTATADLNASSMAWATGWLLGNINSGGAGWWSGDMAHFAIYARALSPAEIKYHYDNGTAD